MTDFIDNRNGNTMAQVLSEIFSGRKFGENDMGDGVPSVAPPKEVRIASAYFNPGGFQHIAKSLEAVETVRLMLGSDIPIEGYSKVRKLGQSVEKQHQDLLKQRLKTLQQGLETERNYLPFNAASSHSLHSLIEALEKGNMEVRRYEKNFLHAKAYIYGGGYSGSGILAGSSNLTSAGLTHNLELNLGRHDSQTFNKAVQWFDELWEDAVPFELAELYKEQFEPQQPWLIFLRVLYQLYGADLDTESPTSATSQMQLTTFQEHGVDRTLRLIEKNGGAIVADEVGLGKTFIAGRIIKEYSDRGQRALLICPAALRDTTWRTFLSEHQMFCECVSYHELAIDKQLNSKGTKNKLQQRKDQYQLIIVDEAHNYRNPDTPARAQIMRTLLFGRPKELLMLTATPVNNSLWDLYSLLNYFIRQDSSFIDQGIISMRQRFNDAAQQDPSNLSPDMLYPIIDATTVKRTRQFIKKHYLNDTISIDGKEQKISFPEPVPVTVRYDLDASAPGLMEEVLNALDPDDGSLTFARYNIGRYRIDKDDEELATHMGAVGLLRSGLLKRFESSAKAFSISLCRIRNQCSTCLEMLDKGKVVASPFHAELSANDEASIEKLLEESKSAFSADLFDVESLKEDLLSDCDVLDDLISKTRAITHAEDTKLAALRLELEQIVKEAEAEATTRIVEADKRKVLVFSFFTDTVDWIHEWLRAEVESNPKLEALVGRIGVVTGNYAQVDDDEVERDQTVLGFAPDSMGRSDHDNLYDVLITTDVLAEGVNLQQCRHIVNYDLPWNPMRLVQRHGRIDRIGSQHTRVFLRSIFPDKQLDALLRLEQRILDKIAMAAATVGVQGPVDGAAQGHQVFTETREEIEKLIAGDSSLYERGGTESAAQSGEEYRHTLREALESQEDEIKNLPWRAGSGMIKGKKRGIFFSAYIGDRPQLCFVGANDNWLPLTGDGAIESELGTCLRLIEAEQNSERHMPITEEQVFPFWEAAEDYFFQKWEFKTDPVNLQPPVRKLNREVINYLEAKPLDISDELLQTAIKVLEGVWSRRDEARLRAQFNDESRTEQGKAEALVDWIIEESGLSPIEPTRAFERIEKEDIKLLCWMVVEPES